MPCAATFEMTSIGIPAHLRSKMESYFRTAIESATASGRRLGGRRLPWRLPRARGRACSTELLEELPDAVEALVDLLHAGREAQPHVRVEAAVVAGDNGDVGVLEQRGGEGDRVGDLRIADALAEVRADVREAVERSLRLHAEDLRQGREPLPHVVAALLELLAHLLD